MSTLRRILTGSVLVALCSGAGLILSAGSASAGGGCHVPSTDATGTTVAIADLCFTPTDLWIEPGQSVTWTNRDPFEHVVVGTGGWGTDDPLGQGKSLTVRFHERGIYPYSCHLHPGMNGAVIVGDVQVPAGLAAPSVALPQQVAETEPGPAALDRAAPATAALPAPGVGGWKVAALVGFGLFALTLGGWVADRNRRRRGNA
jgi:plastocyanin